MRDLNRLGVTSVIDAGGGYQNYPDDYEVIEKLHAAGQLTLRIAYNLFTQKPGERRPTSCAGRARTSTSR
jgi:predicted amidohydrolase YtcJ